MKRIYIFLWMFIVVFVSAAHAQDSFLLPESFFMKKGEALTVHLLQGSRFTKESELPFQTSATAKLMVYEGSKKIDLTSTKDNSTPLVTYNTTGTGLTMVELTTKPIVNELDRTQFAAYLEGAGKDKLAEKVNAGNRESYSVNTTAYHKTIVAIEKAGGGIYDKELGQEYEIVLKQNPYKLSYGDDITAIVTSKGQPLKGAVVDLYVRTSAGTVHSQKLSTDESGQIYFKVSREGLYLLRAETIEASATNAAEYESKLATLTFAFANEGTMPNTYKEFGFGNKH